VLAVGQPERRREDAEQAIVGRGRGEIHEDGWRHVGGRSGDVKRQPGLADARRPDERDQPLDACQAR
jgi:hypothetical protein